MQEVLGCLRDVRRAVSDGAIRIPVVIGVTDLPLPVNVRKPLSGSILRPATESERQEDPFRWGQGSGATADSVLVTEVEARTQSPSDDWLPLATGHGRLLDLGRRLCLAAALASLEQPPRSCPAVTWITELQPAGGPSFVGSGGPVGRVGRADELENGELTALNRWWGRLEAVDLSHVSIGIDRLLRACREMLPAESLIDAVIAWENLVGTSQETSFRVTAALAVLCEDDPALRLDLRRELGKVYTARSAVVHGDLPSGDVFKLRAQALEIGLSALARLVERRPDLLGLKRSQERADRLLLGVPP